MGKDGKKLCIKKYWYRKCDLTDSSQTAEHLHFLSENIPLLQEAFRRYVTRHSLLVLWILTMQAYLPTYCMYIVTCHSVS